MEKTPFNPSEHIAWQGEADPEVPDTLNPKEFASLEAVIEVEKAQITAEAIQQRLEPLFEDLATSEVMLAEATSEEDRAVMQEDILEIKKRIHEQIDKKALFRDRNIGDILNNSSYAPIAYWYHGVRGRGMAIEQRFLSEAEEKMIERYGEIARQKALEFLIEANEDQRKIFDFLSAKGFRVPDMQGAESEEDKRLFGDLFCAVANWVVRFSLPKETDDQIYEKFEQRFREYCDRTDKNINLDAYLADPHVKETLRLWRWFGMKAQEAPFLGVSIGSRDFDKGGLRPGKAQYGSPSLDIHYDAASIRETLKEEAEAFLVPGSPERVQILGIPFNRKLGDDFSLAGQRAAHLSSLLKENPALALRIMGYGDYEIFSKFQIDKVFEEAKTGDSRSLSYLFLGAVE